MSVPNHYRYKSYGLSLDDGNNWCITGYEDDIALVENLASIMELSECSSNDSLKFIYSGNKFDIKDEKHKKFLGLDISNNDKEWSLYDFLYLNIWHNSTFSNIVCDSKLGELKNKVKCKNFICKPMIELYRERIQYMILWYSIHPIYQKSMKSGGLPFHAGLAEYNGHGVLFSAKSGTGKSTCCSRLPSYWKPLCDDEALVVRNQNGKYRVHPFPTWSHYFEETASKTWQVEYSVPVSAIFFLEQSDVDEIIPLKSEDATILITGSATQACDKFFRDIDKSEQAKIMRESFNNAFEMARKIPTYRLRLTLTGRFWEIIEKVIGS